ncbi:MAG: DUF2155 domain-containing protein [Alphaproteobacteria bacterium]|nr:DUF2155 domain-containing protein [Alphaproteobacteria bacterium]
MLRMKNRFSVLNKVCLCSMLYALCSISINSFANANEFIDKDTAVVRVMDKASGRARTLTIPVGKRTEFEKLEILARSCKGTQPFAARDNFMFVEITKKSSAAARQIFSGWMTASAPGDNPLQDPDYDVWLIECQ